MAAQAPPGCLRACVGAAGLSREPTASEHSSLGIAPPLCRLPCPRRHSFTKTLWFVSSRPGCSGLALRAGSTTGCPCGPRGPFFPPFLSITETRQPSCLLPRASLCTVLRFPPDYISGKCLHFFLWPIYSIHCNYSFESDGALCHPMPLFCRETQHRVRR